MGGEMSATEELKHWQKATIESLRTTNFRTSSIQDVTAIAYHYRKTPEELDETFWRTEFAFLQTFRTQGVMPSVLVSNLRTKLIAEFCDKFSIELQIAGNLVPGKDLSSYCIDFNKNLHWRFKTPYVLTIQDDGFPMRPGLENFVGKWDYVGAPWVHHSTYYDLYPRKYCVGNGGFSLRSKQLCEIASRIYGKYFSRMPYWWYLLGDDNFYCKTIRFWFRKAVREMKWPTPDEAAWFSIENDKESLPSSPPLGFHAGGFNLYCELYPSAVSPSGSADSADSAKRTGS